MSELNLLSPHARNKIFEDNIFAVNAIAKATEAREGKDKVINGSIGVLLDDNGKIALLDSVAKASDLLEPIEIAPYAPIAGLPEFREDVAKYLFGDKLDAIPTECIATSGATGALRVLLWNALEPGQTVLTHDFYWAPYKALARDSDLDLEVFPTANEAGHFNVAGAAESLDAVLAKQDRAVLIINTPCHNPTGISLRAEDVSQLKSALTQIAGKHPDKPIYLVIDGAYWEFGDPDANQTLLNAFRDLPENLVFAFAFSIAKSLTRYGMRVGALLLSSPNQKALKTVADTVVSSIRATWSNTNRFGQALFSKLYRDPELWKQLRAEQSRFAKLCNDRGRVFVEEAKALGMPLMPYHSGFFATIPHDDPRALAERLMKQNLYFVALSAGLRVAFCAIPSQKIPGLAGKIAQQL